MRPRLTTVRRRPPGQTSRNGRTAMRPYGRRTGSHAARESREGGALFGGGLGVPPNPYPLRIPSRKRTGPQGSGRPHSPAPLRNGTGGGPAGESGEGAALFGGGLGVPPQPTSVQLPAREADGVRSRRTRGRDGRTAVRPYEMEPEAGRRESPETAAPSLVGAWGYPPTPIRSASRQGSGRVRSRDGRTTVRPYETEPEAVGRESPERAEPSLVGAWGYPPTPIRPASRQGSGRTGTAEHMRALGPSPGAAQDDTARVWVGGYPNASGGLRRRG